MAASLRRLSPLILVWLSLLIAGVPAAGAPVAGYYEIQCSEANATVGFDGGLGVVSSVTGPDGLLEAVVDINANPPLLLLDQGRQFVRVEMPIILTVEKEGFYPYELRVSRLPESDERITLRVYLCREVETPDELLWAEYVVKCHSEGAAVYFDNIYAGTISAGTLTVRGNSSEPFSNITVEHELYRTYSASVDQKPGSGEKVTIEVVLERRDESDLMLYFIAVIFCCIFFGVLFEIFRKKQ